MIRLADPREDRARPESIAMIAVAAWGVGFVLMLGVARLMPRYSSLDPRTAIVARAQLPVREPESTRAVSSTRGMPGTPAESAHIVKPAPVAATAKPPSPAAEPDPVPEAAAREAVSPLANVAAPLPAASPASSPAAPPHAPPASEPPASQRPTAAPLAAASPAAAPLAAATRPAEPAARPQPTAATPETKAPQSDAATPKKRGAAPKRVFSKGVLAYLRCEGSERPHARFPCPRDEKFEESVWRTLAALPMCDTDPGTGTAEVRFLLRKSEVADLEWKAGTSGQSLNLRAIGKCAGGKLADLRTRLRAPEGLVSFRFRLD
jgi:hypothetical protein